MKSASGHEAGHSAAARSYSDLRPYIRTLATSDWVALAVFITVGLVLLSVIRPGFFSTFNIYVILTSLSLGVLVALSQMVVIAIGQLNLSVGAIGGLVAITFSGAMEVFGMPLPAAVTVGFAVGLLCGALNGFVIRISGVEAFAVTLATMAIFNGINMGLTEARPFSELPEALTKFGSASFGPFPALMIVSLPTVVGMFFFMRSGLLGRRILAVGGNRTSAELSGIKVGRVIIAAHVISGGLAAVAAMLTVSRLQYGEPTIGSDWLILSFAAPVIGGAVLAGGHVSVVGTCLGVAVFALIGNAFVWLNVDPFTVQLLLGLLILAAIAMRRFGRQG